MRKGRNILIASIAALALSLTACDKNRVFEENTPIADHAWDTAQVVRFEVNIEDTVSPHNFFVNVRNGDAYRYSNLYLFINTIFPDGRRSHDTLECILADDRGRWLGEGIGDLYSSQILFKKNVRFPLSGTYKFEFMQGMREDRLPMITDIGMRIEKQE
jgi:gliding motility-associated lipoprotein GldH